MAPQRNNDRHSGNTGTIPKSKVRNNCNVPQEAVTPTRRDMSSNLVTTSLDWVPVSEYNSRSNFSNHSRKPTNNTSTSDHELTDLDNSASFESGFGRFVPVRPQPRVLPLNVQNRDNLTVDHADDGSVGSGSGYLHPYGHSMQNGLNPHSNHAAAAVMIVNPTTPNAVAGNMTQPFNAPNQNRNNLTRNLNPSRNNYDGNSNSNNVTPPPPHARATTKTVNLMNNMYEPGHGQASTHNFNDNTHVHRESARALGEAIVASCPDAAAVERRLGQIREYIRVTSSLVDTMRNSEDEAFIEHTKEEYDELVQMVMKLKESENKLQNLLTDDKEPENVEVPLDEVTETTTSSNAHDVFDTVFAIPNTSEITVSPTLKKVTNIENEQINKTLHNNSTGEEINSGEVIVESPHSSLIKHSTMEHLEKIEENNEDGDRQKLEINEIESLPLPEGEVRPNSDHLNDVLRQNILSCVEKVALIEELKQKGSQPTSDTETQDVVVRPMSVQSNGSAFSENELWQNEIKNKMELSHQRLAALKQQQRRLLKYQAETKQQLDEMSRRSQEIQASTSNDNLSGIQGRMHSDHHRNQIGVATTLQHASDVASGSLSNMEDRSQDGRYSHRGHASHHEEADGGGGGGSAGGGDSDAEDGGSLSDRRRELTQKLRELQMKKQHMENLVSEFQKLQMAARIDSSHNTYSSSGEDSADEVPTRKCTKASGNLKNEDPFKLMEIKAIKTALQKTKDLMRSVENYEADHLSGIDEDFQIPNHSNIHDNKSEGGASAGGWSLDGGACRVRNCLPPRHKYTNEQNSVQSHEANIASLQDLAQELRMETEKIMGERARIKDLASNKEASRKQKRVNQECSGGGGSGAGGGGGMGPAERRQAHLRALLCEKQRELEALLNKEKTVCVGVEGQQTQPDARASRASRTPSIVNHSYNSEQEEPDSRSEQILMDSQSARDNGNFRAGDSGLGQRSINTLPSHMGSNYCSDSDSASRTKSNQRSRGRRRATQDRHMEDINTSQSNSIINQNITRHEPRVDPPNVNMVPPISQAGDMSGNIPYSHLPPPPSWNNNKVNQDMRANQFTQNSHSQTMERVLGTPPVPYPPHPAHPALPFNMMMPFGMVGVGGCGCGCAAWAAWSGHQLALQQRELHQLREQLHHLEERWRAETASHTLNNQVPPGNRANNYWDNFRSYSRQNLLSASSKTNACGGGGVAGGAGQPPHPPHPLAERSHNALRPPAPPAPPAHPPANTPKRNLNNDGPADLSTNRSRRNLAYERSLSFSSAPDVLNLNHNDDNPAPPSTRNDEVNVNLNRQDPAYRNLYLANPIPEIIQSHSNNINTSANSLSKKKSSTKLPAKKSGSRRNFALDYCQANNINIASSSDAPNPNLASSSAESHDKASKFFELLRENVYSEVTALIGVNESHPDFLIQLFRELQLISSEPHRQSVLQSIRGVLSQFPSIIESESNSPHDDHISEPVTTTTNEAINYNDNATASCEGGHSSDSRPSDNSIVRFLMMQSEETFNPELLETFATIIINNTTSDRESDISKLRLLEMLSKYEGAQICDVSADILESLPHLLAESTETAAHHANETESSILQDVAGSLNLFSSSDTQLHQMNGCPYDLWHLEASAAGGGGGAGEGARADGPVDLLSRGEAATRDDDRDLAEADQPRRTEPGTAAPEGLPDVVDTDEPTPTEAEAEWLGLDRVPTRLHMEDSSEKQKD